MAQRREDRGGVAFPLAEAAWSSLTHRRDIN
jgi:hypothetical protein